MTPWTPCLVYAQHEPLAASQLVWFLGSKVLRVHLGGCCDHNQEWTPLQCAQSSSPCASFSTALIMLLMSADHRIKGCTTVAVTAVHYMTCYL